MTLNCTEPFIIILSLSQYDLNDVERGIKHEVINIIIIASVRSYIHKLFFLFLHENLCCGYSLKVPGEFFLMSTRNIGFHGEIRKISILSILKKA